jgi:1,4-dihydroxy-2-naphthoate octaprenyltransferase
LSIPVGLLVALVLFANNLRDRDFDSRNKIKTLATVTNHHTNEIIFILLTGLPYGFIGAYVGTGILGWPSLLVFLSLPTAVATIKAFSHHIPAAADAMASKIALSFNFFLLIAMVADFLITF